MRSLRLLISLVTPIVMALTGALAVGASQPSMTGGSVSPATGDMLRQITVSPAPTCSNINVGVAFDGSELLVSNCPFDSNVVTRVNPADGAVLGSITIDGVPPSEGIGAISWDRKNNQLWLATGNVMPAKVYSAVLDKAAGKGTATLRFTHNQPNSLPLIDGIAFDGTDDTIWLNSDRFPQVTHYGMDGTVLGTIPSPGGANSGEAVANATNLILMQPGSFDVSSATKDGKTSAVLFNTNGNGLEGIACDNATFAPKSALWVIDSVGFKIFAFEVPECAQGGVPGQVPPAPTSAPAPTASPAPTVAGATPQPTPPAASGAVDAKVEIVFPHDAAGNPIPVERLTEAPLVNVGSFLFNAGTLNPVPCGFNQPVRLFRAANTDPTQFVAVGTPRQIQQGGNTITIWDFNDVDVSAATNPLNKYYFTLSVDGTPTITNVWSHGADARTIFPQQDVPTGVGPVGNNVDAKVEIVFPHLPDGTPVPVENLTQAPLANIEVAIFNAGTLQSAPTDANLTVHLFASLNNDPQKEIGIGTKMVENTGGVMSPRWVFNDVDVSQAQNPLNKYYFRVVVDGVNTNSNVWSHGQDARTIFPQIDTPSMSCQP